MKPLLVALVPLGLLLAAAGLNRLHTVAAPETPALYVRETEAVALYPALVRTARTTGIGHQPFQTSELEVLRTLAASACAAHGTGGSAAVPICVTWVDDYRRFTVPHRALYDPAHDLLFYQTRTNRPCVYLGVTVDGMKTALRDGTDAPFATAHTFSYTTLAELARMEAL